MAVNPAFQKFISRLPTPIRNVIVNKPAPKPAPKPASKPVSKPVSKPAPTPSSSGGGGSSAPAPTKTVTVTKPVSMTIKAYNPRTGKTQSFGSKNITVSQQSAELEKMGYVILSVKSGAKAGAGASYASSAPFEYERYPEKTNTPATVTEPQKTEVEKKADMPVSLPKQIIAGSPADVTIKNYQNRYMIPESSNRGMQESLVAGKPYHYGTGTPEELTSAPNWNARKERFEENARANPPKINYDQEYNPKTYRDHLSGIQTEIDIKIGDIQKDITASEKAEASIKPSEYYERGEMDFVKGSDVIKEYDAYQASAKDIITELQTNKNELQQEYNKTFEWHPNTRIGYKTKTGKYTVEFPYGGAQYYASYKNAIYGDDDVIEFAPALATAFTGEDFLGLKSAYYTATGNKQAVIDTKIKAVYGTKQKNFAEFYLTSPMGVIGTSYAGGAIIGKGLGLATATFGTKVGAGLRIATGATLGGLAVSSSLPSIKRAIDTGDAGELINVGAGFTTAIVSGYAGAKSIMRPSAPKVEVVQNMIKGEITGQKYLFSIGKRPIFRYGAKQVMTPRQAWDISMAHTPKGRTWWGESEIPRIAQFSKARTDYLNYKPFQNNTYTTRWGNKLFVETGAGWQPQTGKRWLPSTEVYPKPKLYRSYETKFIVIDFTPYIMKMKGWDFKIIPSKPKPFHKTVKDVIKTDKSIEKSLGIGKGQGSGQQQTQTLLKPPKLKTVQKLKLDTITEVKGVKIAVPKQLLKQVSKYKYMGTMQKQALKMNMFKGLKQAYKVKTNFAQAQALKFAPVYKSAYAQAFKQAYRFAPALKYDFAPALKFKQAKMSAFASASLSRQAYATVQLPAMAQASAQMPAFDLSLVQTTQTELKQSYKKTKLPTNAISTPKTPAFTSKSLLSRYRYREFEEADIEKLFKGAKFWA